MGKKLSDLSFSNRSFKKTPFIFIKVRPSPLTNPKLVHVNQEVLKLLELSDNIIQTPSFLRFLNGDLDFEGLHFGSSYYSGHQFGHYVPRLGDGRAILLGEVQTSNSDYFELQLKGAGLTPFSRMGDGRAVVRSSIREYLASAHLKALGIPTTQALAVITGDDDVYRESVEKGAIVLRVAESFLRFGHFEYYHHSNKQDELNSLVEFVIENYFTKFSEHSNRHVLFLQEVTKKTAQLFARWQAVGFCHGVLNTDNMSILGLTLDYGPFGFIDNFNQDYICNHSDHEGRYSFGNQPSIGLWNLTRLSESLVSFISPEDAKRTLETYQQIFFVEYRKILLEKCGLFKMFEGDEEFLRALLNMLVFTELDYTVFFRSLSVYEEGSLKLKGFSDDLPALKTWLGIYDERLKKEGELKEEERHLKMSLINPKFILRNYLAQMVIEDLTLLPKMYAVMTDPFLEWEEFDDWSRAAPPKYRNLEVSCSS